MSSQSTFSSACDAMLFAVKLLQKTPAHQDRWIADVDIATAIRHEFKLWDVSYDDEITYRKVNSAVNSNVTLKLALDPTRTDSNTMKMFRRQHKPATMSSAKVLTDANEATYSIEFGSNFSL